MSVTGATFCGPLSAATWATGVGLSSAGWVGSGKVDAKYYAWFEGMPTDRTLRFGVGVVGGRGTGVDLRPDDNHCKSKGTVQFPKTECWHDPNIR